MATPNVRIGDAGPESTVEMMRAALEAYIGRVKGMRIEVPEAAYVEGNSISFKDGVINVGRDAPAASIRKQLPLIYFGHIQKLLGVSSTDTLNMPFVDDAYTQAFRRSLQYGSVVFFCAAFATRDENGDARPIKILELIPPGNATQFIALAPVIYASFQNGKLNDMLKMVFSQAQAAVLGPAFGGAFAVLVYMLNDLDAERAVDRLTFNSVVEKAVDVKFSNVERSDRSIKAAVEKLKRG